MLDKIVSSSPLFEPPWWRCPIGRSATSLGAVRAILLVLSLGASLGTAAAVSPGDILVASQEGSFAIIRQMETTLDSLRAI